MQDLLAGRVKDYKLKEAVVMKDIIGKVEAAQEEVRQAEHLVRQAKHELLKQQVELAGFVLSEMDLRFAIESGCLTVNYRTILRHYERVSR